MYFRDLLSSLLRRWYVAVLGIGLTVYLCTQVVDRVQVTYDSDGSVLLLPPKSSVGDEGNPYLYLGGLTQAVDVLVARLQSDTVMNALTDAHPDTTITAVPDNTTTGPIIKVTATGLDADASLAATRAMMDELPTELADLQTELNVPEPSRITSMDVTASEEATPDTSARDRLVLAAGAVGAVLSILLAGLIDGLIVSRRNRRAARRERAALAVAAGAGGTGDEQPEAATTAPDSTTEPVRVVPVVAEEPEETAPAVVASTEPEPAAERRDEAPDETEPQDEPEDEVATEATEATGSDDPTDPTESEESEESQDLDESEAASQEHESDEHESDEHGSDEHEDRHDKDHEDEHHEEHRDQRPEHASSW